MCRGRDFTPNQDSRQTKDGRVAMRIWYLGLAAVTASIAGGLIVTALFAQPTPMDLVNAMGKPQRYLPEYTESGELILPKNFREWVFVGSPLTPIAQNGGKACHIASAKKDDVWTQFYRLLDK